MNNKVKVFTFVVLFTLATFYSKASAAGFSVDNVQNTNVDINKEWVVKFNSPLKADTVNSKNIIITDENNKTIGANIMAGNDSKTIIVTPSVSGYEPSKKYNLVISTNVQSITGKKLTEPITVPFTVINKYSDGTNYSNLPQIIGCKFDYTPLLPSQKQGFVLTTKNNDNVQYRVFVHSYSDNKDVYDELTNGYTSPANGKIVSLKTLKAIANGQKYKVLIYVKRTNVTGAHKDSNTDYDNYYIDYFRCVDSINKDNITYTKYDKTIDQMVDIQTKAGSTPVFVEANIMNNTASKNQIKYYINPDNFLDNYGKYQFLKLNYSEGISVDDINNILKGKGILEGKGQAFLDAAKNNNISVAYLVSHALLETGNGTSVLANGGTKDDTSVPAAGGTTDAAFVVANGDTKDDKQNYTYGVPVYNFFGIGAYDADANYYGTKTAYENKWFTPEDAISGGAKWIASRYINNPTYKQDTLYKMRWNPLKPAEHQYATDISWAYKQIPNIINGIKQVLGQTENVNSTFDVPQFK
ncbi:N-acetylglucosaminidase [Clostridium sp. DJ247]|uniref:N-acetylglucosaminidase n=1 Tax=Clostridium sp. DJ247 TaxID=2726188 RepID=UPI0037C0DC51|nr:hydrolase [Clostridium sp. DJ247]